MIKKKLLLLFIISFLFIIKIDAKEVEIYKLSELDSDSNPDISVQVDMVDSSGKALEGAKLKILDSSKRTVIEWNSYDEPVVIINLEEGFYYLVQSSVPDGYEKIEEEIKFEVSDSDVTLELVSSQLFYVPGTMSSNSILMIFIGMFNIALGIGILVYVKKNKA